MMPAPSPQAAGARVLMLVDDEPDILEAMQAFAEDHFAGLRVITAPDGQTGLARLGDERVDLIISDYKMPNMDGIQFLRECARRHPATPRIMLTAFNNDDLERRSITEAGVGAFLSKAADPAVLLGWMSRLLRMTALPSGLRSLPTTSSSQTAQPSSQPAQGHSPTAVHAHVSPPR